ncbi:MAG TPA: 30S ribosomal protein S5 [Armatimonadota bacterium]|nr:30S ribosomal protein S5 [Armatimonadota bacterium]
MPKINPDTLDLTEQVIRTNKVQKTHKGGRKLSWNVLSAVGDKSGHVGVGLGKARAIPDAIRKSIEDAKKNMIEVPLVNGTIPHEVELSLGASIVMLKPAAPGNGVVAGGAMRPILELAGITDVLAKSHGSGNAINTARATMEALKSLKRAEQVSRIRGKRIEEMVPWMLKLEAVEEAAVEVETEQSAETAGAPTE